MTQIEKAIARIKKLKNNLPKGACAAQIVMEMACKEEAYNEVLAILKNISGPSKNKKVLKALVINPMCLLYGEVVEVHSRTEYIDGDNEHYIEDDLKFLDK